MTKRKILVLGGTGGTGRQVIAQALDEGHDVTVLVRDPTRLGPQASRVRAITGSLPRDAAVLDAAMAGQQAVISTLGVGKSFKPGGVIADSVPLILSAMQRHAVRRLIFCSAYGVGETWRDVPLVPRVFMRTLLRDVYADKARGDAAIRDSALDWTIVHPTTLADGPRTGQYRVGERLPLRGFPKVARADVAHCLLSQLDDAANIRRGVLVSY